MTRFGVLISAAAVGAAVSGNALAQSSVTLYGIVDQSIRYTTNADAANDGSVQMANGAKTGVAVGLRHMF